jgi:APA family basic amino acid/polyamine antiporter
MEKARDHNRSSNMNAESQQGRQKEKTNYGLLTATTMIIGIVIGSGIFFKSDDVLIYTGGDPKLGALVFCIGALSIIFGSLTLIEFSVRTKKNGGFVGYYEDFISKRVASGFGWFQTFVYYPSVIAVVSWVASLYIFTLFNIQAGLEAQIILGLVLMTMIYVLNIISVKVGGYFQNASTILKLIPLIGFAIIGLFWGASNPEIPAGIEIIEKSKVGFRWVAALTPIAYSYDGWTIATSITNEVKNPKKNMSLALVIGPLIVLGVYLMYFLGLSNMLGAEYLMSTGNNAVNRAGELILGSNGSKIIVIFIIISVLGVVNGVTLGSLRMPQALASKKMIPDSKRIAEIQPKLGLSLRSCLISYVTSVVWVVLHYLTQKTGILKKSDVSEISVVFSYTCYIVLYIKVIRMWKDKAIDSFFKGIICPVFAIMGSLIILIGGIVTNPFYVIIFMFICFLVCTAGFQYYKKSNQ